MITRTSTITGLAGSPLVWRDVMRVLPLLAIVGLTGPVPAADSLPLVVDGKVIEKNIRQTNMDARANPFWTGWTQRKGTTTGGIFVPGRGRKNLLNFPPNRSALGDCEFKLTFKCDPGAFRGRPHRGPWLRLMDRGQFGFVNAGTQLLLNGHKMSLPLKSGNFRSPVKMDDGRQHSLSIRRVDKTLSFHVDDKKIAEQPIDAAANLIFDAFPLESYPSYASLVLTAEKFSTHLKTRFRSLAPVTIIFDGTGKPQETVSAGGAKRIAGRDYAPGKASVYRIPSLVVTNDGTILAFAEARASGYDWGHIRLVVRRSRDNGKTWGPEISITSQFADNSCGNPSPVVERETGRIFLVYHFRTNPNHANSGPTHVGLTHSDDDGKTWSKSRFVTEQFKPKSRSWLLTGPGHGIQLTQGRYRGRLVIPCYGQGSGYVVYSDDKGETWTVGGSSPTMDINEAVCVELLGGDVMLNARSPGKTRNRGTCTLTDGGKTLKPGTARFIPELPDPNCQGSTLRHSWPKDGKPGMILYAGPGLPTGRVRATLWASYDEGKTWPFRQQIYAGGSGYSDLAVLPNGKVLYLFEKDGKQDLGFTIIPAPPRRVSEDKAAAKLAGIGAKLRRDDAGRIVEVDLGERKTTDADLVHLVGLRALEELSLHQTRITGAGLVHLKGLTTLKRVFFSDTAVDDQGVSQLKELKNLKVLGLSGTRITDRSLEHLAGLKGLSSLFALGTKVTDAGVAKLGKALPDCDISH